MSVDLYPFRLRREIDRRDHPGNRQLTGQVAHPVLGGKALQIGQDVENPVMFHREIRPKVVNKSLKQL
jgi:hypothetical protein